MQPGPVLKMLWKGAYRIQSAVNAVLLLGVVLLVVVQVLLRYVFRAPLMGIEELLLFPAIWLYMLGGASASWERSHIECGIMTLYIKRPFTMKLFRLAKAVFSVATGSWLLYWAYWYFAYGMRVWKTSAILNIPLILGQSAIFIGMSLMVLYAIVELLDYARSLFADDESGKEDASC